MTTTNISWANEGLTIKSAIQVASHLDQFSRVEMDVSVKKAKLTDLLNVIDVEWRKA